jgi:hypothetical protein
MLVTFNNNTGSTFETGKLNFLPTGKVRSSSPEGFLRDVNDVLAPTINEMHSLATAANITNFDFWELMNWIFVSQYWLTLLDFGQIAPATFQYDDQGNILSYEPIRYSAENNIFINGTLFNHYNSYLRTTILPLYGYTLAEFLPLNDKNRLQANTTTLKYLCSDLKLKAPLSLIVSVIVADWGLISPAFSILVFFLGVWKLRKLNYGILAFGKMLMKVNDCRGCMELRERMNGSTPSKTGVAATSKLLE